MQEYIKAEFSHDRIKNQNPSSPLNVELVQKDKECVRDFRMKSSLFWDVIRSLLVFNYRHFGTTYRSNLQRPSSPRRIS